MTHYRDVPSSFAARHRRGGFTLVELLVVMGIIAVMISLLLPALAIVRRSAGATQCLSNLRQIGMAMIMYANDNKGAVPGVEYDGVGGTQPWQTYNALPYDCRPYVGGLSSGYLKTPAGGINAAGKVSSYAGLGLLCSTGYLQWSPAIFCPGRASSDPLSWEANSTNASNYKTSGGYNPGWGIDNNGFATNFAGYLVATTNRASTRVIDFGKANRLGKCYDDTPLAMEVFWWGEGATMEGHGNGYNIAKFDGSAEWYPDPGYTNSHKPSDYNTSAADDPHWPVEVLFTGPKCLGYPAPDNRRGANATPMGVAWDFSAIAAGTGLNWFTNGGIVSSPVCCSRWVGYGGNGYYTGTADPGVNGTSGIPFIEKYLMGWNDAKIASNTPK